MADDYQDDTPRIQIITKRGKPGDSLVFEFEDVITQYCYGISNFRLDYHDRDDSVGKEGRVKVLKVELRDSGKSGKTITINVDAEMSDNDKQGINDQYSYVDVSCIAAIHGAVDSLTLAKTDVIDNDSSSEQIKVGDNPPYLSAFLSSFDFDADDGQRVKSLDVEASTTMEGQYVTVRATAVLTEHKDAVTDGTITAGVAATTADAGVIVTQLLHQSDKTTLTFTNADGNPVKFSYATAFLTNCEFQMLDDDDNYVMYFSSGCESCTLSDDGTSILVGRIGTRMGNYDDDGKETDYPSDTSKTQVWVIGAVASDLAST